MNLPNAIALLALGIFMRVLPVIAPALVPVDPSIGTSARELWLILTGYVIGGTGAAWLLREGMAALWGRATARLRVLEETRAARPVHDTGARVRART